MLAEHRLIGLQIGQRRAAGTILVAGVDGQAIEALKAERDDVLELASCHVEDGDGVVFLQGNESLAAIWRESDVFRLKVLADGNARELRRAIERETNSLGAEAGQLRIEGRETGGGYGSGCSAGAQVDDADRPDRVGGVDGARRITSVADLGLVGNQELAAVGAEGDHIRQRADAQRPDHIAGGGVEQEHRARVGLG